MEVYDRHKESLKLLVVLIFLIIKVLPKIKSINSNRLHFIPNCLGNDL